MSDCPYFWDYSMVREQLEHDRELDRLEEDHGRDEVAQPQLPVQSRDDRRAA